MQVQSTAPVRTVEQSKQLLRGCACSVVFTAVLPQSRVAIRSARPNLSPVSPLLVTSAWSREEAHNTQN